MQQNRTIQLLLKINRFLDPIKVNTALKFIPNTGPGRREVLELRGVWQNSWWTFVLSSKI